MDPPTHTYAAMSGALAHRPHTTRKSMGCSVCHTIRSKSLPVEGGLRYIYPLRVRAEEISTQRYRNRQTLKASSKTLRPVRTSILQYLFTLTLSHYTVVLPLARFARSWPILIENFDSLGRLKPYDQSFYTFPPLSIITINQTYVQP